MRVNAKKLSPHQQAIHAAFYACKHLIAQADKYDFRAVQILGRIQSHLLADMFR